MTLTVTADYLLPEGQTLSATNEDGLAVTGRDWRHVDLNGHVVVTDGSKGFVLGVRVSAPDALTRTVTVGAGGTVSVTSTRDFGGVSGIGISGDVSNQTRLINNGAIDVHGTGGSSGVGVGLAGFENHGSVVVEGRDTSYGVYFGSIGGELLNTGRIEVTAGDGLFRAAIGIYTYQAPIAGPLVNSGSIIAHHAAAPSTSIGMQVAGWVDITNSGLIEGDNAIQYVRDFYQSNEGRHVTLVNSGTLRGAVVLNNSTGEPVTVTNTGLIQGDVALNLGADTYSGVGGVLSGALHANNGADSLIGGSGADQLFGDAGDDTIDGGAGGLDHLDGGDGTDLLTFAGSAAGVHLDLGAQTVAGRGDVAGFERYEGSRFADVFQGSASADRLAGGAGGDTINAGGGADTVDGGSGANYLRGDEGDDTITGGADFDDINGNMGNDTAHGGVGGDWVVGGKDQDQLFGDDGDDIVYGNLGEDTCDGGVGADLIRGGQGNDILDGGFGDDWLSGDRGNDTLTGGLGADTFHSFGDAGIDRVRDFSLAQGDRVQLDAGTVYTVSQVGSDTVIAMAGGGQLILVGMQMDRLEGAWLVIV